MVRDQLEGRLMTLLGGRWKVAGPGRRKGRGVWRRGEHWSRVGKLDSDSTGFAFLSPVLRPS